MAHRNNQGVKIRQKSGTRKRHGEKVVKDIRRATRKRYSAGEKIRIVLDGQKLSRVWNRFPEPVREKIKNLTLKASDLSPQELAVRFTDTEK